MVASIEKPPPSHVSSEGGVEGVDRGNTPSVSRFERGRAWGVCRQRTLPSRNLSKGGLVVIVSKLNSNKSSGAPLCLCPGVENEHERSLLEPGVD